MKISMATWFRAAARAIPQKVEGIGRNTFASSRAMMRPLSGNAVSWPSYIERYAAPLNLELAATLLPEKWARFREIKQEIFALMAEADEIAPYLRNVVVSKPDTWIPLQ
jgi:hypothetical protein